MPSNRKRRIRQRMAELNMSHQEIVNLLAGRGGQQNPLPWLIEKAAVALSEAGQLVDLANEPDTNAWYRRELKSVALRVIARLLPVLAVLCDRRAAAGDPKLWDAIANIGTEGLVAWMQEYELTDELDSYISSPSGRAPSAASDVDRDERIEKPHVPKDAETRTGIKLALLRNCAGWLLGHQVEEATQRLVLRIMTWLEHSEYVDVVTLSRRILPDDIGATSAETEKAYRTLWEAGVIEPADYLPAPANPDCFNVRVILHGVNETKYPRPYRPETFGPGRKDGYVPAWEGDVRT